MPMSGMRGCCAPPVVLPTRVSCLAPCSSSALIRLNGTPGMAKPPKAMVAPSGMSATASRHVASCFDLCGISPCRAGVVWAMEGARGGGVKLRAKRQRFRNRGAEEYLSQMETDARGCTQMVMELNVLSGRVIGCAFTVLNALGVGFLEKVYENALALELRS